MTGTELLQALDFMRSTMIAVATGGPKIKTVNGQYQVTRSKDVLIKARIIPTKESWRKSACLAGDGLGSLFFFSTTMSNCADNQTHQCASCVNHHIDNGSRPVRNKSLM